MQAICKQNIDAVELARQVISGILNDGMPDQHDIEFHEEQPGKAIQLNGDKWINCKNFAAYEIVTLRI